MPHLNSKTKTGHVATTFAWMSDDQFVTEFYPVKGPGAPVAVWQAPAVMSTDDPRRIDYDALRAYHEANIAMWNEDNGADAEESFS